MLEMHNISIINLICPKTYLLPFEIQENLDVVSLKDIIFDYCENANDTVLNSRL